jgi:FkbM family methyltransferase
MTCHRCPSPEATTITLGGIVYPLCASCARPLVAHLTSTPTMTVDAMQTPFPILSRGHEFRVMACGEMWHPSWWSFQDEIETRELWWHIKPGDVVADVGADFGSYTLSALAQGASRVFAWSPPFKHPTNPVEAHTLASSANLNGWLDRLSLSAGGLWSEPGYLAAFDGPRKAKFFASKGEAAACIAGQPGNCATFHVSTLDSMRLEKLDWLKVDTEGCELEILVGGRETIRRCTPDILLEHHYHIDPDCEKKCEQLLRALDYVQVGETRPHGMVAHSLYQRESA